MGFSVQQSCPQCGAPVELDETDHLIECPYCEVSSIICPQDYLQYVMQHNASGKELIYAPYLRFRGAAYYCQGNKINHRIVDISDKGASLKALRPSLGVRTQTVNVSFVSPETEGFFLALDTDPEDIITKAAKLPKVASKGILPDRPKPIQRISSYEVSGGLADSLLGFDPDPVGLVVDALDSHFFGGPERIKADQDFTIEGLRNMGYDIPSDPQSDEIAYHVAIGETLSIVYLPLYLENDMLYDGVVNDPIGKVTPEDVAVLRSSTSSPRWKVNFVPIMCPHCGWDLQGSRNSVAFTCSNCFTAWEISEGKLGRVNLQSVPGENDNAQYLPFWKIKATSPDLGIQIYSDLLRLDKPLMPQDDIDEGEVFFIVPAFKIAPKVFLTTADRFTFTQHALPPAETGVEITSICAVTMPREEAIQAIKMVIASGAHHTEKIAPLLPDAEVNITDSSLVYLPFNDSGYELSAQHGIPVSIIKQSIELIADLPLSVKKEPEVTVSSTTCPLCGKEIKGSATRCPYCGIGL